MIVRGAISLRAFFRGVIFRGGWVGAIFLGAYFKYVLFRGQFSRGLFFTGASICMSFFRSSHREVFLLKGILQICSKITREHPCQSVIIVTLLCSFIEITFQNGFSPVKFMNISRKPFQINT